MKKLIYLFLFSISVTLFAGCSKESVMQPQTEPEQLTTQLKAATTRAVLYVNNFNKSSGGFTKIFGNTIKEDSLLDWCKAQGFTEMNLYTVGPILSGSSIEKAKLNAFISKAHSVTYGLKVNFVVVSSTGVNDIGTYCANYPNKPDGIITEYEFWNSPYSWSTFKKILNAMTVVHNTYPSIKRYAYVSEFTDANGVTSKGYIAKYLIENCETIFLTNYYTNAYNLTGYLQTKLAYLTSKAKQINKVGNVIILFNVSLNSNSPDIYSYFSTNGSNHEFIDAYNNLMDDYNDAVDENNDGLSFKGYAIYRYTSASKARP